jgi:Cys-tRNA synthase (O-phospho-L-seryl-tRNA:Cys-tRNA synthase)
LCEGRTNNICAFGIRAFVEPIAGYAPVKSARMTVVCRTRADNSALMTAICARLLGTPTSNSQGDELAAGTRLA